MTRQEEIKEGIELYIRRTHFITPAHLSNEEATLLILNYLHSQGVVIKVEMDLPHWALEDIGSEMENAIYKVAQQDMLKWHEDSFEPLIKEEK